jgi:hypothetical protein
MTNHILNIAWVFLVLFCLSTRAYGQNRWENEIKIPFDSITKKYTYVMVVEVPTKSAADLYETTKEYTIVKYADDNYILDKENSQLIDVGDFTITSEVRNMGIKFPVSYKVFFSLIFSFKEGKTKIEITNIRLVQNLLGTNYEQTMEEFIEVQKKMGLGKNIRKRLIINVFMAINVNVQNLIAEIESELKEDTRKKSDW